MRVQREEVEARTVAAETEACARQMLNRSVATPSSAHSRVDAHSSSVVGIGGARAPLALVLALSIELAFVAVEALLAESDWAELGTHLPSRAYFAFDFRSAAFGLLGGPHTLPHSQQHTAARMAAISRMRRG